VLRRGHGWQNTLRNCDDVLYRKVKILSFSPYGDGLDPVSSRNVRIEDCFFRCSDDCIAIKALRHGPKVADIAVRDSVMVGYAFSDGVTIGFEADTESIENISVKNCDIVCATGGNKAGSHSAMSIICDGPAEVRNVTFEDIRVEESVPKLFELNVTDGKKYTKGLPGHIRNVQVKNIRWDSVRPIILHGQDEDHLVEDVTFEGCHVAGKPLAPSDVQSNDFVKNIVIQDDK
jgi:polygalacturonase